MHIAICDDNVADRKQLERLLKKESDKRAATTGILYTDSYGNASALLSNPMQYDAFFIDMCETIGVSALSIATELTARGVSAPLILCCSKVNYREQDFPGNTLFLDKPIRTSELSASIDHALRIKARTCPLIELREDKDTIYVTEADILYAVEEGRLTKVTLADGRSVNLNTSAANFFSEVENHPSFLQPSVRTVINCRHVRRLGFHKAVMTDGTVFKIAGSCMAYARDACSRFS